ncbi:hypothetical protein CUMW_047950 [Citrus unshiu]|nr:hypothetical protein CUMW_047950 [Citrus unshiu]
MKLSLKLPDDSQNTQNPPILKVKIPITIFNQPFISSLTTTKTVAASSQHLSFSLGTNFPSGPSFKLNYTPLSTMCTSTTPFSFSLKSGLGLFGSPQDSPLIFSAHFSLSYTNPTNFTHTSISDESSGWQDLKLEPRSGNENDSFFNVVDSIRSDGIEFVRDRTLLLKDDDKKKWLFRWDCCNSKTVLPVTKRVMMNLRWGVNLPADSEVKMPYLTMNKIGTERVEKVEEVKREKNIESDVGDLELFKGMLC